MSNEGLANAIAAHLADLDPEPKHWIWVYAKELYDRADRAEHKLRLKEMNDEQT